MAALLSHGPDTATAVALALDQVIVAAAGAAALLGLALIEALTEAAAVTVIVADCVTGPAGPWAVIV